MKDLNFKTKIGVIIALPIYAIMMIAVAILTTIIWMIGKTLNILGIIDGLGWLMAETRKKMKRMQFISILHSDDQKIMKKK